MSYCRWSSDDYQCDVYVYEHVAGFWTTHVARNRVVWGDRLPEPVTFDPEGAPRWVERHNRVMDLLDHLEWVDIDHPEAGQHYDDPTAAACADRLEHLKAEGFVVPQYAIDELRAES